MTFPLTLFVLQEGHGIEAAHEVAGEAFELTGILLLVAVVGALALAKRKV